MTLRTTLVAALLLLAAPGLARAQDGDTRSPDEETRMLRHPTVSGSSVAFAHGGDLWIVPRSGGEARRLTATPAVEEEPAFSPDGTRIAFTATVAGNTDVYVVPAAGGDPTRLTWHPRLDRARGWTSDGRVLFASGRATAPTPGATAFLRLWTVGPEGGFPEPLPMPRAFDGAEAPGGDRVAYDATSTAFFPGWDETSQWRHYRGGRTNPLRIMDLDDHTVEELPWTDSNDTDPMWVGDTLYFLSDRSGTVNLFAHRPGSGEEVTRLTRHDDFDVMNASAGGGAIVYERAGHIHLFDTGTGEARRLSIRVRGDFPWARPRWKSVDGMIRNAALSPTGARAAFEARGDVFTLPTGREGDVRNLTRSSGAHDRIPVWSPDGKRLAWLSDAGGEYRLMVADQTGLGEPRAIDLPGTAFYSEPAWSPGGERLLLRDNHLNLWMIELASGETTRIDTDAYDDPGRTFRATWSPDGRWVAYSKSLESHQRAIFLHSVAEGTTHQVTDGMADAISPVFDAGGDYLWFLASTDYALNTGWLEMSSMERPVTRSIYLAVLEADEPSPLRPATGDEPGAAPGAEAVGGSGGVGASAAAVASDRPGAGSPARAGAGAAGGTAIAAGSPDTTVPVQIDLEGLEERILAPDVPAGDYRDLEAGPPGSIFYTEAAGTSPGPAPRTLRRYRLADGQARAHLEGIVSYTLSADRQKLLYGAPGDRWGIVPATEPASVGQGRLRVEALEARVDPREEWAQIFRETWRLQREFFYDPGMHGADWDAIREKYRPLVDHVRHRDDLTYLIATVGGELAVGHSYAMGGGDMPGRDPVSVGLLGADFTIEDGRYRFRKIYRGENWNPDLRAPLRAPGLDVEEGDYLLAVNGEPLEAPTNVHRLFEGTAGDQTILRVNDEPTVEGSRVVTVVPTASEAGLRTRAWVEDNRRRVDSLSNGRLAYVWLPNTSTPGYEHFNRYYFAQQDREGVVIDERYNQGGTVADYIVDVLDRERMGYFARRDGEPSPSPLAAIYGPKVMVINESAGSGGDALPYYFRLRDLGPLVGTRTWGGLVGTLGIPPTIDGGSITAPSLAFYDLEGEWAVENEGVAPDVRVEQTPSEVIDGGDPQLERAVQEAMRLLEEEPARTVPRPPPPDRTSGGGR